jgi:hypothetical protein
MIDKYRDPVITSTSPVSMLDLVSTWKQFKDGGKLALDVSNHI